MRYHRVSQSVRDTYFSLGVGIKVTSRLHAGLALSYALTSFDLGFMRDTALERHLFACDELTGFVGACALVRPSKKIADVPVESVLKRLKEKAFAQKVDREYVRRGAEEWGRPLPELVALVLASQVPIAAALGLDGAPAADLPDAPCPPAPPMP